MRLKELGDRLSSVLHQHVRRCTTRHNPVSHENRSDGKRWPFESGYGSR